MDDKLVRYADLYFKYAVTPDEIIKEAQWGAIVNVLRGAAQVAAKAVPRAAAAVGRGAASAAGGIAGAATRAGGAIAGAARAVASKASLSGATAATKTQMAAVGKELSSPAQSAFKMIKSMSVKGRPVISIKQVPQVTKGLSVPERTALQLALTQHTRLAGTLSRLTRLQGLGSNIANIAKNNYASALAGLQTFKSAPLSTRAGKTLLGVSILAGFLSGPPNFKTPEGKQLASTIPKSQPVVPNVVAAANDVVANLEANKAKVENADEAIAEVKKFAAAIAPLSEISVVADDPASAGAFTEKVRAAEAAGVALINSGALDEASAALEAANLPTDKIGNFMIALGGFLNGVDGIRSKSAVASYRASPLRKEAWVQLALFVVPLIGMAGRYIANMDDDLADAKEDLTETAALADKQLSEGAGKFTQVFTQYSQAAKQAASLIDTIKTPPKAENDPAQVNAAMQFATAANTVLTSMQPVLDALADMRDAFSYMGEAVHWMGLDFGLFDATRYQAFQNAFSRMQPTLQKTIQGLEAAITKAQNDAGLQVAQQQVQQAAAAPATPEETARAGNLAGLESVTI